MGNFAATGAAGGAGEGEEEAPAKTVEEVAMMTKQSASLWPTRRVRTLANLQDGSPEGRRPRLLPQSNQGGQPVRPSSGPAPAKPPRPLLTLLPNHRDDILRDRIEGRHRLRVSLERTLRNNQIRKFR